MIKLFQIYKEIKVNNPSLTFPIYVKTIQDWKNLVNKLNYYGYHFYKIPKVSKNDFQLEDFPIWIYNESNPYTNDDKEIQFNHEDENKW